MIIGSHVYSNDILTLPDVSDQELLALPQYIRDLLRCSSQSSDVGMFDGIRYR